MNRVTLGVRPIRRAGHGMKGTHTMSRRNLAAIRPIAPGALACTETIARALAGTHSHTASEDYLFLEAWERAASLNLASLLRAAQIRRANPELAAALRAELSRSAAARADAAR